MKQFNIIGVTKMKLINLFALIMLTCASPSILASEINSGDTAWILTATALVLFMTLPGLALFYGGLVRTQNVLSVLMQCFAICCIVSVLWVVYGYSLAFTGNGSIIGGTDALFLSNLTRDAASGTLPESLFIVFQMTFAVITPALVVVRLQKECDLVQCVFLQFYGYVGLSSSLSYGLGWWIPF